MYCKTDNFRVQRNFPILKFATIFCREIVVFGKLSSCAIQKFANISCRKPPDTANLPNCSVMKIFCSTVTSEKILKFMHYFLEGFSVMKLICIYLLNHAKFHLFPFISVGSLQDREQINSTEGFNIPCIKFLYQKLQDVFLSLISQLYRLLMQKSLHYLGSIYMHALPHRISLQFSKIVGHTIYILCITEPTKCLPY